MKQIQRVGLKPVELDYTKGDFNKIFERMSDRQNIASTGTRLACTRQAFKEKLDTVHR